MLSLLEDDLDLSILDSFNDLNQDQNQKDKKETKTDIDLSVLDDAFPKEPQPLSKPSNKITSKFGTREDPFGLGKRFHNGVDIPMKKGTPVSSLGRGIVIKVGDDGGKSYGKHVIVDYGGGLQLTYGHLDKIGVEVGDKVTADALVGLSGSTGRSKSPHLHIRAILNGKAVNPEDYFGSIHDVALGALSGDDVVEKSKLDLSVLENLDEEEIKKEEEKDKEVLDLSSLDQLGNISIKPLEQLPYKDERTIEEKIAAGAASGSQIRPKSPNPNDLVGGSITTIIPVKGVNRPNVNTLTDYWLGAVDSSYAQINAEYRGMTGRNLIEFTGSADYIGDNKYKLTARFTKSGTDIINAYIDGRKKGGPEAGWEAAYFKSQEIKRQEQIVRDEINNIRNAQLDTFAKRHPYLSSALNILTPVSAILTNKEDVKAGIANAGFADAQLVHNLRLLPEALYKLYRYGGDSKEYEDLIEKDRDVQEKLYGYQSEVRQPEDFKGKVIAGATTGLVSFPKYATFGAAGLPTLPTLVYVENLHRGNTEAAKAALPMAMMSGLTHGMNQFFGSGTKTYIVAKDKNGVEFIKQIELDRGLGNIAPFKRIKGEISINPDAQAAFLASEPVSIGSLSPLERQLIMRGTNAFQNVGVSLGAGVTDPQELAANFIVGLSFPVGKDVTTKRVEGRLGLIPYIPEAQPRRSLLAQPRVNVETGNATLFIPLDDAALNLLDLRRALKDPNTIKGLSLKDSVARQISIQKAIEVLGKQIPAETLKYFEDNEGSIRSAIKSNYEANKAREEYLGNKASNVEFKTPNEVKENPNVNVKESPIQRLTNALNRANVKNLRDNPQVANQIAKEVFGNTGENNRWITPDRALFAFDRLSNVKSKDGSTLRSGLDLAAIGKDLVEGTKSIVDLTQISAFYLEDFYHRKIEPSVTELANKFRVALGDIVKGFSDKDFQVLFEKGKEYLDSNIADPFFSRMKQDAVEKLPNRFNVDQARNILSQHKDEFEWTSGLSEFLEANKDKKISKQELIDVIQKGQVRVEESVAREVDPNEYKRLVKRSQELTKQYDDLEDKFSDEATRIDLEREKVHDQIDEIREGDKPKYSLQAYTSEKLELPGAKNSKEVKLISPSKSWEQKDAARFGQFTEEEVANKKLLYQSPHWSEGNVVAHYRSNDRITTDNQRVYFGEEFQSDWNHDIREKGLKPNKKSERKYAEENVEEFSGSMTGRTLYKIKDKYSSHTFTGKTKEEVIERYVEEQNYNFGVEPNPFMQHNWKELVLKRFLRDAVIAKDENGNYKYDGVGWTTARQQLERYGGILEGKEFKWYKNADDTYTFSLNTNPVEEFWQAPHELDHITLDRFAELTMPEAAQEVRDQEATYKTKLDPSKGVGTFRGYDEQGNLLLTEENPSGRFSLKEAVELRSKEGTYADYDVAYKNILNKIGKRFGAKYGEKDIKLTGEGQDAVSGNDIMELMEIPRDKRDKYWRDLDQYSRDELEREYRSGKLFKPAKIHYLEITPSMRSSLEKEGLPLYGTGRSEALKSPEVGVRNKLVTFDAFNQARENLVKKLTETLYHASPFDFDVAHATGRHPEGWTYFTNNLDYANKVKESVEGGYMGKFHPIGAKYAKDAVIYTATEKPTKNPLDIRELKGNYEASKLFDLLEKNGIAVPDNLKSQLENNPAFGDTVEFLSQPNLRQFIRKAAIEKGFDGLIINDEYNGIPGESHVAFNPTKVKPTVFNSGLNPEAFIDQVKLLYSGIKDLVEFTKALTDRYGPSIKEFAEDFYWAIKGKASDFNDRLNISIDKWQENLNKVADNPAWQIRNSEKGERGSFSLRKKTTPELKDYYEDKEKHQVAIGLDYRAWLRGIALSQISTEFGKVYDTMRSIQRVVSSYETKSLNRLMLAKKTIKLGLSKEVADAIYQGNEWINPATGNREGKVWSDPELITNFGLDAKQIQAYKDIRYAIDNVLNLRLENKLYSIRESSRRLTDKLVTLTAGTPEYDAVANKILDLADLQKKTIAHYDDLKKTGYISLQRKGKIAAFIEDPSFPIGDPNRKIYNQFENVGDANKWIQKQKAALGLPTTTKGSLYDIRNLRDIVLKEKLTPSQFEDLVDRSSANSTDPSIEKLREEVYSKFPSFTYQLKREFVRGYDRDLQTAINSTVDQLELYTSSFYSKVGREEGLKQLEATGIEKTDPNLYRLANSYINDETAPAELNWLSKGAIKARRFTYLWQLGFDVNQLWLNAVAQPITQTYGYFYRVTDPLGTGKQLTGLEPEHYFLKAGKQANDFYRGKASVEFNDIVNRLKAEKVLSPEFTKTFIEAEAGTGKTSKLENWASIFMRTGEHLTRLHAASEAYLIGKEKFHLTGEDLVSFIVKSVDATQSNPTRGENPFVVRQFGEGGKLFYQFMAFNQMWWENLALGVKNNIGVRKGLFLARELAPLAIMGGLTGLPLSAFAGTLYTLITDKDPKKEMDKYLGDDTLIEQATRYGITTSAGISQKVSPQAPVLDQVGRILTTDQNNIEALATNAPAIATGNQIWNLRKIVTDKNKGRHLIKALPRSLKGPATAIYTLNEGYKAGDTTLLSRRKITPVQTAGQIFNIAPTPVIEKFEQQRTKKLRRFRKSLKKAL